MNRTLTTAYSYDDIGNLLAQVTTGEREIAYRYSYNRNGNITGEVRTEGDTTTESTYAYDALGQLTSFMQSTGYGESYTYDRVGNMTKKVISGMDGEKVALSMAYNRGNQMVRMSSGQDGIAYTYDQNGSMVKKVLTSKTYGTLTDSYSYNSLDQLTGYVGYDGYQQVFTYDANGMRVSKSEKGNPERSTLEELLRGNISGLPEVIAPTETEEEYSWATTEYLYDLTQEYYQVIQKSTAGETTIYEYGLERVAEYSNGAKNSYVYDGRGSVVLGAGYTPFGEQMGATKVGGYGYNAEDYDAATGMLNLRARQYEPAMNRFSQKDIVRGQVTTPQSLNRYPYAMNNPVEYGDPSGNSVVSKLSAAWNKAKQTTIGKVVDKLIIKPATSAVKAIAKVVKPIVAPVIQKAVSQVRQTCQEVQKELATIDPSRPTCEIEKKLVWNRACSKVVGDEKAANDITRQLERIQSYDKYDWLFMTGDCLFDDSFTLEERFKILDILKEKQYITAEDLIQIGVFTEETRYHPFFFRLLKEDVAGNAAALLELSYKLSRQGTTIQEMSVQEQQMCAEQQRVMLYYLAVQAGMSSAQANQAASGAIRMDGATVATPGYESVPSDFQPFNYTGSKYDQPGISSINFTCLPENVKISYDKYEKSGWAGNVPGQTSGTAAGAKYYNRDQKLPSQSSNGDNITYREFDVNNRQPNSHRDSERFVVGSDGSIYYTNDHYLTFVKIK